MLTPVVFGVFKGGSFPQPFTKQIYIASRFDGCKTPIKENLKLKRQLDPFQFQVKPTPATVPDNAGTPKCFRCKKAF